MQPVLTKNDFVRRYSLGEFGNRSPTWDTYEEWWEDRQEDGWEDKLYHVRNRVAGGKTYYNVKANELEKVWRNCAQDTMYISEMAPTDKTVLQGEVRCSEQHIDLTYSTAKKPMREALAEDTKTCNGIKAIALLNCTLCDNSMEWLYYLLQTYPDHVVEFSTYECNWGTLPHYNTVFWECRLY